MNAEERLDLIEKRLQSIEVAIAEMTASNRLAVKLIKYVILPLIVIMGALVGVKII